MHGTCIKINANKMLPLALKSSEKVMPQRVKPRYMAHNYAAFIKSVEVSDLLYNISFYHHPRRRATNCGEQ